MAKSHLMSSPETSWVIIAGHCDPHDLRDVEMSVRVLQLAGVLNTQITVFLSLNNAKLSENDTPAFLEKISSVRIFSSEEVIKCFPFGKKHVVIVAGHGGEGEIACYPPMKPAGFLDLINSKCSEAGLLIFSQCFSGIFNYLPVTSLERGDSFGPEFTLIGATEMTTSSGLSLELIDIPENLKNFFSKEHGSDWCPNFFLLHTLLWFLPLMKRDVDGDGSATALDLFKFTLMSTSKTMARKRTKFLKMILERSEKEKTAALGDAPSELDIILSDASQQTLEDQISGIFSEQTPWILNAALARRMIF